MTIQDALNLIGTVDNASGQICQLNAGDPTLILFEFGCPNCSEVAGKHADDYGEALASIVNAVPALLKREEAIKAVVADVLQGVYEETRGGAQFENVTLAISSRIALRWMDLG